MKKSHTERRRIPSCELTLDALRELIEEMLSRFEGEQKPASVRIDLRIGKSELSFDSVDDLKSARGLPTYVTGFSVMVTSRDVARWSWVSMDAGRSPLTNSCQIKAKGENEGWCYESVESMRRVLLPYRRWFSPLSGDALLGVMALVAVLSWLSIGHDGIVTSGRRAMWGLVLVCLVLWSLRHRLFPAAVIRIRSQDNWIRRYQAELGIALSLLAVGVAAADLAGWGT